MAKYPQYKRAIYMFNTSRAIIYLVISTLISFLINHFGKYEESPFHILGTVPAGLERHAPPTINKSLIESLLPQIPSLVVLMIMEHGAISSSLGKVFDYRGKFN
jgi:sodium-independent sulfate anion transporter 11